MKVYHRREHPPLKWVLAGALFLLVMTLTVTEVNGFNRPPQKPDDHKPGIHNQSPRDHNDDFYDRNNYHDGDRGGDHGDGGNGGDCNPPTAVPEPTTMALLGIGLGGMVINRVRARTK